MLLLTWTDGLRLMLDVLDHSDSTDSNSFNTFYCDGFYDLYGHSVITSESRLLPGHHLKGFVGL